jgi:nucleoid DNA-binding protein
MTRKELIAAVHAEVEKGTANKMTKSDVERVIGVTFDKVIPNSLMEGEAVSINDFGKFEPVVKAARVGRNPQSGDAVSIPEKAAVKFKPATALKSKLN